MYAITSRTSYIKQLSRDIFIIRIVKYVGFIDTIIANIYAIYSNSQIVYQSPFPSSGFLFSICTMLIGCLNKLKSNRNLIY